jgi:hypothetical protein
MTVEEAIKEVKARARWLTRFEGQEPYIGEVLVAEIKRLRIELAYAIEQRTCQCSYDDGCRFALERDAALSEVKRLRAENEQMRTALRRVAVWPYDIMGDCVAEAKHETAEAAKDGE